MNIYIELLLLALVVVFIVDLSGFTQTWKNALGRWLHVDAYNLHVKPFDCSLCMVWWVTLAATLIAGQCCLATIAYCAFLALFADLMGTTVRLVKDALIGAINWIYSKIKI